MLFGLSPPSLLLYHVYLRLAGPIFGTFSSLLSLFLSTVLGSFCIAQERGRNPPDGSRNFSAWIAPSSLHLLFRLRLPFYLMLSYAWFTWLSIHILPIYSVHVTRSQPCSAAPILLSPTPFSYYFLLNFFTTTMPSSSPT